MTDLREIKPVALDRKGALGLWKAKRIETVLALEARVASLLTLLEATKEGIKGLTQPAERILQNLGIDSSEVFPNRLDRWELNGLGMVVNRDLIDLPGIAPLLKSSIIKFSANIKPLLKDATKAWRGLEFELVRLHKAILHKELYDNNYFIQERKNLARARCENSSAS